MKPSYLGQRMVPIYQHREAAEELARFEKNGRLASHLATPYTEFAAIMS
jgi:hypothetical protein